MGGNMLAVDWGNTGLRAWPLRDGELDGPAIRGEIGLGAVPDRDFAQAFTAQCRAWLEAHPNAPVVLMGMVGARGNWHEATYVPCPLDMDGLVAGGTRFSLDGREMAILPGARHEGPAGADVMRGEEVQILGAAALSGLKSARFCIPGTHAKWGALRDGRLTGFTSHVTGELFGLLRHQSLVGRLAEGDDYDDAAFHRGLDRARAAPLAAAIFSARAEVLTGGLAPGAVSSYLSGLLLGAELDAALNGADERPLVLLAGGVLAERYGTALAHFDATFTLLPALDARREGLVLAARRLWPETALQPA